MISVTHSVVTKQYQSFLSEKFIYPPKSIAGGYGSLDHAVEALIFLIALCDYEYPDAVWLITKLYGVSADDLQVAYDSYSLPRLGCSPKNFSDRIRNDAFFDLRYTAAVSGHLAFSNEPPRDGYYYSDFESLDAPTAMAKGSTSRLTLSDGSPFDVSVTFLSMRF
jgi:hypothetical protein